MGIFVLLCGIGGAVAGTIGGALFLNTDAGKKADEHLSQAFKFIKDNLLEKSNGENEIINKEE